MRSEKTYESRQSATRAARKAGHKDGEFEVEQVWQKGGKSHWRYIAKTTPTVVTEPVPSPAAVETAASTETVPVTESGPTTPPAEEPVRKLEVIDYANAKPEETPAVETTPAPATTVEEPKAKPERVKQSTVTSPVKFVWAVCEDLRAADPNVSRKVLVDTCIARGVAFYTAKTQVQRFLKAKKTNPTA